MPGTLVSTKFSKLRFSLPSSSCLRIWPTLFVNVVVHHLWHAVGWGIASKIRTWKQPGPSQSNQRVLASFFCSNTCQRICVGPRCTTVIGKNNHQNHPPRKAKLIENLRKVVDFPSFRPAAAFFEQNGVRPRRLLFGRRFWLCSVLRVFPVFLFLLFSFSQQHLQVLLPPGWKRHHESGKFEILESCLPISNKFAAWIAA